MQISPSATGISPMKKLSKLLKKRKKHFINEYRNGNSTSLFPLWLRTKSETVLFYLLK